jgi:NADPH:quinone reductase-like Zn-dependent oxidoreductase/NAD(P)-dependent dehydrogenase (short-subunit alcohol dehydrogenase family)/aryl carrier-like protein
VARTLGCGRDPGPWRAAARADDPAQAAAALRSIASGEAPVAHVEGPPRIGMLFTGQGAQHPGMAVALYEACPAFRRALDDCAAALQPHLPVPLLRILRASGPPEADIHHTSLAQPALFAVELAMARTWAGWGVRPSVVVGHSVGEIAAAVVAGVLELEHAAALVAHRGRLMGELPAGGAMAAVEADEATVQALIDAEGGPDVCVAAVNGAGQITVSGDEDAVQALLVALERRGIAARPLSVSHAFHSPRMDPVLPRLRDVVRGLRPRPAAIAVCDALTGGDGAAMVQPAYWVDQVRAPVRFRDALDRAERLGVDVWIEVGPAPVLLGLAGRRNPGTVVAIPSLRPGRPDPEVMADALCRLHTAGAVPDWSGVFPPSRPVTVPTTPFDRSRHWIEGRAPSLQGSVAAAHPLLGHRLDLADPVGAVFELSLSASSPPWLADHAVGGRTVAPAALWLELARAAASQVAGRDVELRDVAFDRALAVGALPTRVQVSVSPELGVRIHSRGTDGWLRHASARALPADEDPPATDLAPPGGAPVEGLYDALAAVGLAYGPAFRRVRDLFVAGDVALAAVDGDTGDDGGPLHPAVLDAALHPVGAVLGAGGTLQVPVSVARYRVVASGRPVAWARVERTDGGADVALCDARGAPVARLDGLALRPLSMASPSERPRSWVLSWVGAALTEGAALPAATVVGTGPLARALREALPATGAPGVTVFVADPGLGGDPVDRLEADLARLGPLLDGGAPVVVVTAPGPAGAGLWGYCRTAAQERPGAVRKLVDIGDLQLDAAVQAVLAELRASDDEDQVRYRGAERRVARLVAADADRLAVPELGWRLERDEHGLLDGLRLAAAERPAPGPGQVEIAVDAAGLNFRDVLNALGRYPGPAGALGGECVGRITALGAGVADLRVGDAVMALAPAALARFVLADAATVVPVPRGLDAVQAVTLPIAFATAWYALVDLARVQRGERVLVHAAAGGVGMAAVQLALHLGCEVVGTASPHKQDAVRALGASEVHSSRTLAFAEATAPVDVVVNALTGPFIPASLGLLRAGGRLVELGKAEIWSQEQVEAVRPGVRYTAFDLAEVAPARLGEILREVAAAVDAGALRPLPARRFEAGDAVAAFRFMARAAHIGKIVLVPEGSTAPATIGGQRWLITGGLGALGRRVAAWLVERGVRALTLSGRTAPDSEGEAFLAQLRGDGAEVGFVAADLSDRDSVWALLDAARPDCVVHAAGVLSDAALSEQTPERIARVLAAKARGAWWLHEGTRDRGLQRLVLFSSVAGTAGSVGQAGYAAANAFLDGLAEQRHADGLPCTSVAWGPWAGEGMAATLAPDRWQRLAALGIGALSPADALRMLEDALGAGRPAVVAAALDPSRLRRRLAGQPVPPLLRAIVQQASAVEVPLSELLAGTSPGGRTAAMERWLRGRCSRVLGASGPDAVDPARPLRDLGLDSLMATDLHNEICRAVGQRLGETLLLDHPTVEALAEHLVVQVLQLDAGGAAPGLLEAPAEPTPAPDAAEPLDFDEELRILEGLVSPEGGAAASEPSP